MEEEKLGYRKEDKERKYKGWRRKNEVTESKTTRESIGGGGGKMR